MTGSAARPAEHNPPLIIDSDAVESTQVPTKCMKTITRRRSQVIDVVGSIDDIELVQYGDKYVLRQTPNPRD